MPTVIPAWFEIGSAVVLLLILAVDVFLAFRRPHIPSSRESGLWIGIYVLLALIFAGALWAIGDADHAGEFVAGWLTEYSLSVDNLFIFVIIMASLRVPRTLQQYALMVGIMLALVFRGVFIGLGAAAIERFSWIFFAFGAFLIYTAIKLYLDYRTEDEDEQADEAIDNLLMRWIKRVLPSTSEFHGTHLTVREAGRRLVTPMLFVIVALGSTDLLFALDSIPAIYGLTQEPYLVFAATVFALMGLRQLYFLIGGLLQRLVYLSLGLAIILAFIGVKLVLHAMHEYHLDDAWGINVDIPIWLSLLVIIGTLAITTVASLIKSRHDLRKEAEYHQPPQ